MVSRVHQTSSMGFGGSVYIPGLIQIHEQSLAGLHEVRWDQLERFIDERFGFLSFFFSKKKEIKELTIVR